jgi:hypothetical protein
MRSRWAVVLGMTVLAAAISAAGNANASGAAPCRAGQLSAKMSMIRGSAGAGNIGYSLALTNNGSAACQLGNHPRLRLLRADGRGLPTEVFRFKPAGTVTIPAGGTAAARLRFSPDIPGIGEPAGGRCEPLAHKVKVTLTQPASGHLVGSVKPATSVCEHGSLDEQPLKVATNSPGFY